jgi:hypothetical protein
MLAGGLYQGRNWLVGEEGAHDGGGWRASFSAHPSQEMLPPDSDVTVIQRCIEARGQVAREVIAGRLTLLEAAARFQAISLSRPSHLPVSHAAYSGDSDEERLCRQVIAYVDFELQGRPDRSAVVAKLNSELRELLATFGTIILPRFPVQEPVRTTD